MQSCVSVGIVHLCILCVLMFVCLYLSCVCVYYSICSVCSYVLCFCVYYVYCMFVFSAYIICLLLFVAYSYLL